jgi:hypothetical protein
MVRAGAGAGVTSFFSSRIRNKHPLLNPVLTLSGSKFSFTDFGVKQMLMCLVQESQVVWSAG